MNRSEGQQENYSETDALPIFHFCLLPSHSVWHTDRCGCLEKIQAKGFNFYQGICTPGRCQIKLFYQASQGEPSTFSFWTEPRFSCGRENWPNMNPDHVRQLWKSHSLWPVTGETDTLSHSGQWDLSQSSLRRLLGTIFSHNKSYERGKRPPFLPPTLISALKWCLELQQFTLRPWGKVLLTDWVWQSRSITGVQILHDIVTAKQTWDHLLKTYHSLTSYEYCEESLKTMGTLGSK